MPNSSVRNPSGRSSSKQSSGSNGGFGQNTGKTGPNNSQNGRGRFTGGPGSHDGSGTSDLKWECDKEEPHNDQSPYNFPLPHYKKMETADPSLFSGPTAQDLLTVSLAQAHNDCEDQGALLDAMLSGLGLLSGPVGTAASTVGVMNSLCKNGLTLETGLDAARLGLGSIPVLGTPLKVLDGADLGAKAVGAPTSSALLADSMRSLVAKKDAPGQGNAPAPKTAVSRNQTELFKHYAK